MSTARLERRARVTLVSYATAGFLEQQQSLSESARALGVESVASWTRERLCATAFYAQHRLILDVPRGGGYWLWKPYIILTELERAGPGEFVVYSDCGYPWRPQRVRRPLDPLLAWCAQNGGMLPGVYVPEHGPSRRWTKRECFVVMGCDREHHWNHPLIQTSFSVWQRRDEALRFVAEWLRWCEQPQALVDAKIDPTITEFPDFVDHRHDQSVLTNLALLKRVRCFGDPHRSHPGTKDIDNLTDRMQSRWLSIMCRNYYRRATAKYHFWRRAGRR